MFLVFFEHLEKEVELLSPIVEAARGYISIRRSQFFQLKHDTKESQNGRAVYAASDQK